MTHRLMIISLVCVAGCGASADPAQPFVGTWSYASGTNNVSCPNGNTAQKLTGNLTVKPATEGGLVVLDPEGCNFSYALAGNDATLNGKNACQFAVPELGQGVTAAVTYDDITLTTADGKTMTDTFAGKVSYTASNGTLDCAFSGTARLDKVSAQ
ncbi:MAG: hypothetical protein JWN44_826 [Myxococcales bacterium]|nr:hypothetical protein [Myxococcales bacterium]